MRAAHLEHLAQGRVGRKEAARQLHRHLLRIALRHHAQPLVLPVYGRGENMVELAALDDGEDGVGRGVRNGLQDRCGKERRPPWQPLRKQGNSVAMRSGLATADFKKQGKDQQDQQGQAGG